MAVKKTSAKKPAQRKPMDKKKVAKKPMAKKPMAQKPIARKVTASKTNAKKVTAKRTTAKRASARRSETSRTTPAASERPQRRGAKPIAHAATPVSRKPPRATKARRGDLIIIDSAQVGSPPREGEVLRVIHGEVSISYRVKWSDGHETLISPAAGTVTIVRA